MKKKKRKTMRSECRGVRVKVSRWRMAEHMDTPQLWSVGVVRSGAQEEGRRQESSVR